MTQPTDRPEVREAWDKWYYDGNGNKGSKYAWLHQQQFIDALTERVKELEKARLVSPAEIIKAVDEMKWDKPKDNSHGALWHQSVHNAACDAVRARLATLLGVGKKEGEQTSTTNG